MRAEEAYPAEHIDRSKHAYGPQRRIERSVINDRGHGIDARTGAIGDPSPGPSSKGQPGAFKSGINLKQNPERCLARMVKNTANWRQEAVATDVMQITCSCDADQRNAGAS
ncbi:MAG: hypothetical protein LAO08_16060 [Acidobacteriia bacterium]|nr:hypothetical protein [Terriglobia bacterium]